MTQPATALDPATASAPRLPLCVDLDGTLVRTDTLWEAVMALLKTRAAWQLPFWLLRGRAHLKQQVALHSPLDVSLLPYRAELVEFLRRERERGRTLVLATAADRKVADGVAAHLGLFDEVLASDGRHNLKGKNKGQALCARFGRQGFDYAGDAFADLPVWREAAGAIVVGHGTALSAALRRERVEVRQAFPRVGGVGTAWLRAVRVHQWSKNLLLFAPVFLSHNLRNPEMLGRSALAFIAFTLCAASVYLLNDLLDLEADRRHPRKRSRPFAAGNLPLAAGLVAVPLLALAAAACALPLPAGFAVTLAVYLSLTLAYSLRIKQMLLVDVVVLAGLYTLRILAGGQATGIPISPWTLGFSTFLFLSLALVKRVSELRHQSGEVAGGNGRAYRPEDLPTLTTQGIAAGYLAVLVLALYINSQEVLLLHARPQWLWLVCPLAVYWIARVWLLTSRGQMNEDPVVFALRDRVSHALGAAVLLLVYLAS